MIVRITGGLGNQMFQYAFKLMLDHRYEGHNNVIDTSFYKDRNIHNGYELKRIFNIEEKEINVSVFYRKVFSRLLYPFYLCNKSFVKTPFTLSETRFGFYNKVKSINPISNFIFDGYWQSEDYFVDISDTLRKTFTFPALDDKNKRVLQVRQPIVSVHIRRGDFLKASMYRDLSESEYYTKAIEYIHNHIEDPFFLFFSDDPDWVSQQFEYLPNKTIVNWNKGADSFRDMQLMSLCKHNIVANSSFSWWGAWLNNNPNKIVIAPSRYFTIENINEDHLVPSKWIRI